MWFQLRLNTGKTQFGGLVIERNRNNRQKTGSIGTASGKVRVIHK